MSAINKAVAAYDGAPPDWVMALAYECDRTSQNKAAARLKYSASAISHVLNNGYGAKTDGLEETVRGTLMAEVYACPVLGDIHTHVCRSWRAKAKNCSNRNSMDVMMYKACHRCPIHTGGGDDAT